MEPLNWTLPPEPLHGNMSSSSTVSPTVSPIPSSAPSPSSAIHSPAAVQDNLMHVTSTTFATSTTSPSYFGPAIIKPSTKKEPYSRAPISRPSPAEEELVRRIHRKVGGPAKLSTYDDPAKVRHVVIEALAHEQLNDMEACRIRKGQLSAFERRVVRTVTNRGAAVRSRMRQRKELAHLKHELYLRNLKIHHLESIVRTLCSTYAVPLPNAVSSERPESIDAAVDSTFDKFDSPIDTVGTCNPSHPMQQVVKDVEPMTVQSSHCQLSEMTSNEPADLCAQQQMLGSFDPVAPIPWS